jgi:LDH2 family malate/lactate/ureidoglycolate dehydrogenase
MVRSVSQRISFDDLKLFCKQAYIRAGVPDGEAEIAAGLLARSYLRGTETHGVMRLLIYIQRLQKGYVQAVCNMTLLGEKGGTAFLEAHGSMGHVVSYKAMDGYQKDVSVRNRLGLGKG